MFRTTGGRASVGFGVLVALVIGAQTQDTVVKFAAEVMPYIRAVMTALAMVFAVCLIIAPWRLDQEARAEREAIEAERAALAATLKVRRRLLAARIALGELLLEGNALRNEFYQWLDQRDYNPELQERERIAWERCTAWRDRVLQRMPEVDPAAVALFLDETFRPQHGGSHPAREAVCNWLERRTAKLGDILSRSGDTEPRTLTDPAKVSMDA